MFRPFAPWRASCGDGARRRQPTRSRRSVMLKRIVAVAAVLVVAAGSLGPVTAQGGKVAMLLPGSINDQSWNAAGYGGLQKLKEQGMETARSEEHTSELQSLTNLVCRLLLDKKK